MRERERVRDSQHKWSKRSTCLPVNRKGSGVPVDEIRLPVVQRVDGERELKEVLLVDLDQCFIPDKGGGAKLDN